MAFYVKRGMFATMEFAKMPKSKVIGLLVIFLITFPYLSVGIEEPSGETEFFLLQLSLSEDKISFQNLRLMRGFAIFSKMDGDYQLQLLGQDGKILYENRFTFIKDFFPEPRVECFNDEIAPCRMELIPLERPIVTVYFPKLSSGSFVRIQDENGKFLVIDLENPPYDYIDESEVSIRERILALINQWFNGRVVLSGLFSEINSLFS